MDFYIGQKFDKPAPPDVSEWCKKNNCHVVKDGDIRIIVENPEEPKLTTEQIVAEYDLAMENYMKEVREKRGYTTREPSDYVNSTVERWRQDAVDWIAFRDAVLVYAMEIENKALETGEIPSIDEFVANMPTITWTID